VESRKWKVESGKWKGIKTVESKSVKDKMNKEKAKRAKEKNFDAYSFYVLHLLPTAHCKLTTVFAH